MKVCPKCGTEYGDDANFCTADAGRLVTKRASTPAPVAAAPSSSSGLLGGRFQLGARIGGDATGAVHRAIDTKTGETVAVKLVAAAVVTPAAQAQRVERELKLLERVQNPHVARVIASGKQGGELWVATEWVDGGLPLSAQVEAGVIDVERATEIVAAIGGALLDAAKVGLMHRDLSPKNVLVAGDTAKLINFAIATPGERVAGVPEFVSPEVIEGKPIDQRSMTYSLGALTYYLLTGQPPFTGDPATVYAAHLAGQVPPPSSRAHVAPGFDAVVGKAMDRTPARRYLLLKQFLDDLGKVQAGGLDPATTAPFGRVGRGSTLPPSRAVPSEPARPRVETPSPATSTLRETPPVAPVEAAPAREHVHEDSGARRGPAPTIQAPAVPPPAQVAPAAVSPSAIAAHAHEAAPAVDDLATIRTPTLTPEELQGIAEPGAPSPWAAPAGATPATATASPVASPAAAMAANVPQAGLSPDAARAASQAAPASVAQAARPAAAVEPPAREPERAAREPAAPAPSRKRSTSAPQAAGGKRKPGEQPRKGQKGKFRETLWFKKGDLDAVAAAEAAVSKDASLQDKADTLPIEERYVDDGTVTSTDAERYSLKTGQTSSMPSFRGSDEVAPGGPAVGEEELIGEMKKGRTKIILAVVGAAVVLGGVIAAVTLL